jgi:glycine cleavage system H protein
LEANPESVNSNPYGDGWMIKIEMSDASEVEGLLSADEYQNLIG